MVITNNISYKSATDTIGKAVLNEARSPAQAHETKSNFLTEGLGKLFTASAKSPIENTQPTEAAKQVTKSSYDTTV